MHLVLGPRACARQRGRAESTGRSAPAYQTRAVPEDRTLARPRLRRALIRSAVASFLAFVLEYVVLTVLVGSFHLGYLASALLAGVVYFAVNFPLSRRWAFCARRAPVLPQLLRHGVVVGGATVLGLPLLWIAVNTLRLPYQLGWLAAAGVAFIAWTFPMHRFFTYRAALQPAMARVPAAHRTE